MSLADDLRFAVDLARGAGAIVRRHYRQVDRLTKTHAMTSNEAVTEGDRASQRHIIAALRDRFPGDGLIGEESETGDSITFECKNPLGRNWVIDPIDGTNNFVSGVGVFGVCIGLLDGGHPVLGVVYDVTRDLVYCAAKGEGAWVGSEKAKALTTPLDDSSILMLSSNLIDKDGKCPAYAARWIAQTNWKIRIFGSAAIEAVMVGAGVAHGAVTVNGKLWDCVAPAAIVLEAGGTLTDLTGKQIFPFDLRGYTGAKVPYLSAGVAAHAEVLSEINR
ncbi:MAG: putative inositol-monophosphatase [Phycisphaerales bacterium]|nr:putative inositol-monophosphatase [Phycisphaerales bacterium]